MKLFVQIADGDGDGVLQKVHETPQDNCFKRKRTKNQEKKISTDSNLILPFTFRKCLFHTYAQQYTQKIAQVNVGTKFILCLWNYISWNRTLFFFLLQCNRIRFWVYLLDVSIRICWLNLQLLTRPNEHIDKIKWNLRFFFSLYKYIARTALFEMFAFRWCNAKRQCATHCFLSWVFEFVAQLSSSSNCNGEKIQFVPVCNWKIALRESNLNKMLCFLRLHFGFDVCRTGGDFQQRGCIRFVHERDRSIEWTMPIVGRQTPMMIYDLLPGYGKSMLSIEYKFKMAYIYQGFDNSNFKKSTVL